MKDCLLVFVALSQVKRVKKVLEADGNYFDIARSPHCIAAGGCSYAIRCDQAEIPRIASIARDLGIAVKGAHRERAQEGGCVYELLAPESA